MFNNIYQLNNSFSIMSTLSPNAASFTPRKRERQPLVIIDPSSMTEVKLPNSTKTSEMSPLSNMELCDNKSNEKLNILKDGTAVYENIELVTKINNEEETTVMINTEKEIENEINTRNTEKETDTAMNTEEVVKNNDMEVENIVSGEMTSNCNEENKRTLEPDMNGVEMKSNEVEKTRLKTRIIFQRDEMLKYIHCNKLPKNLPLMTKWGQEIFCLKPNTFNYIKKSTADDSSEGSWKRGSKIQKLVHHENGYLPPKLRTDGLDDIETLKRNIKKTLNKLTPENFDSCLKEILSYELSSEEELTILTDKIFDKAILEESYSKIYSKFSAKLNQNNGGNSVFKALLLSKCKTTFMKPLTDQMENVRSEWMTKIRDESDERMKNLYTSDIEEQVLKAKDKYFGNIRFISELYLQNLLSGEVMIYCIEESLNHGKDENCLEAVCKLLEVCGKTLEESYGDRIKTSLDKISVLSTSKDLDTKIRFKLKDILDMKNRGWVLRQI